MYKENGFIISDDCDTRELIYKTYDRIELLQTLVNIFIWCLGVGISVLCLHTVIGPIICIISCVLLNFLISFMFDYCRTQLNKSLDINDIKQLKYSGNISINKYNSYSADDNETKQNNAGNKLEVGRWIYVIIAIFIISLSIIFAVNYNNTITANNNIRIQSIRNHVVNYDGACPIKDSPTVTIGNAEYCTICGGQIKDK